MYAVYTINFKIFSNYVRIYRFQINLFFSDKKCSFIPWLLNSFDIPSYGSESRKKYTLRILSMCLREEGGLEIALPDRAQMTYLGRKRLYGRLRGYRETMQINEKINFIQDSFQKVFQHCKSTSHWLLLEFYILYHIKMHISEYVCKTFLEELAFFSKCRDNALKHYCSVWRL